MLLSVLQNSSRDSESPRSSLSVQCRGRLFFFFFLKINSASNMIEDLKIMMIKKMTGMPHENQQPLKKFLYAGSDSKGGEGLQRNWEKAAVCLSRGNGEVG